MKYIILAVALALSTVSYAEEKETVKVCVDVQGKDGKPVIDPKTKQPKQDCKTMKKHKKHDGTKIPDKSDKK